MTPSSGAVLDAVVVGGGPAGLAVSRELSRRGIDHVVLESATVGASWERYYRSLVLHTGKHLSALPGMPLPEATPLFPPREAFLSYLRGYARHFRLPIREGVRAERAEAADWGWRLLAGGEALACRALVVATGIAGNPVRPDLPGQAEFGGAILHSSEYREPGPFAGKRVLVIGAGNSGGEIAAELGRSGADAAVSVRSGAHLMPLRMLGLPSQYWSVLLDALPPPLPGLVAGTAARALRLVKGRPPLPIPPWGVLAKAPLIGDSLPRALRSGRVRLRGALDRLLPSAARFADGSEEPYDAVILATGFRPALGFLAGAVPLDANGFPVGDAGSRGLFFLGHRYGSTGALYNIRRDAPRVAAAVAERLRAAG